MINESIYILLALILLTLVVAYLIKYYRRIRYYNKLHSRVEETGLVDDKEAKEILKLLNVQSINDLKKYPADIYDWEIILKYFTLFEKRIIWSEEILRQRNVSEAWKKALIESNSRPLKFIQVVMRSSNPLAGSSEIIRIDTSTKKQSKSGSIQY